MTNVSAPVEGTMASKNSSSAKVDISQDVLYVIYVFNGLLALVGVVGNISVCFIIIRGRKMYTIANFFLMNLAIADLFILGISYPLWIIQSVIPHQWPFGEALCKIIPPISDTFYGVSVGCIMAIAFHRYRMIMYSMGAQMRFVQAKCIVIFFYGISLLSISAPIYPVMQYLETRNNVTQSNTMETVTIVHKYCYWKWPSWSYERSYMTFLLLVWYIIPLLVILFTFVRIKFYLQEQIKYHWLGSSVSETAIKSHVLGIKKALHLLAPVVIVFTLLMLPWNILRAISLFMKINQLDWIRVYLSVAATMLVFNSAANPFIYYITANEFRKEFKKHFRIILNLFKSKHGGNGKSKKYNHGDMTLANQACQGENEYVDGNNGPNFDELFREYRNPDYNIRNTACTNVSISTKVSRQEEEFISNKIFGDSKIDVVGKKFAYDSNQNNLMITDLEGTYENILTEKLWKECTETIL